MANDIVKQIILSFKGDTKQLQKDVNQMKEALSKLDKVGSSGSAVSKLAKNFQDFSKSAKDAGITLSKDFTRVQKIIKEIATQDLRRVGQEADQMAQKAERRLKRLQEMERQGASGPRLDRARRLASGTDARLGALMESFNERAAGMGGGRGGGGAAGGIGPFGQFAASAITAGAIAALPDRIASFAQERHRQALVNPSVASNFAIQQRLAAYQGDATMGVLGRKGAIGRAQKYAEDQSFWGKFRDYGTLGAGAALLGGGALAAAGAVTSATGVGAIAGVPMTALGLGMMGAGGAALTAGGTGVIDRVFNNKTEAEKTRAKQEGLEAEKARLIDPQLYASFRESAESRARLQNDMGMTSHDAYALRLRALDAAVTPEQQDQMMRQFRPLVGARQAGNMSVIAGQQALMQGMDVGTSSQMLMQMASGGKGGSQNAQKQMEDMFTRAVEAGITDAGLRESLEKATSQMVENSNIRMDSGQLMSSLLNYMPAQKSGEPVDPRAARAAEEAMRIREDRFGASNPLDDSLKRSVITKQLRQVSGGKVNISNIDTIRSMSREQILQGNPDLDDMGFNTADKRMALANQIEGAMGNVSPEERAARADIQKTMAAGGKVTDAQLRAFSRAKTSAAGGAAGFKGVTVEGRMAEARGEFPTAQFESGQTAAQEAAALSPDQRKARTEAEIRAQEKRRKESPEAMQRDFTLSGQAQLEKDMRKNIGQNVGEIIDAQKVANRETAKAGDISDPGRSATQAVSAMDKFAGALDKLADRINGKFGNASPQ